MVKCEKCGTDLGPSEQLCPLCHAPRSTVTSDTLRYMMAAIRKIPSLITDEDAAATEYDDFANMLELAGRGSEAFTIRQIAADEKKHKTALEAVKRDLEAFHQIRAISESMKSP